MADPNNIQADAPYRTAIAERGKFFPVDQDYLESVGYPTSGEGKYAILTYSINDSSSSSPVLSGDIEIGAVELKDADTDDRVNIQVLPNTNAVSTMIVDENGDQITSFGTTPIAETGTPTPVASGEEVDLWVDGYGRQVIYGANTALNALDVNLLNDSNVARLGPVINLNAAVTETSGTAVDVSLYHNFTIQILATDITTGLTVNVEHSLTGNAGEWSVVGSVDVTANGSNEISISQQAYLYLRTSVVDRTDGTITTYIYGGN